MQPTAHTAVIRHPRHAFTLIEVMVVVAIIGILASLAVVNYSDSQQKARDSRRKQDVSTYAAAVGTYVAQEGNATIQDTIDGRTCDLVGAGNTDPGSVASGPACVGANGRGYGFVNASSGTVNSLLPAGAGTGTSRNYASVTSGASITSALRDLGFLAGGATDPSDKDASVAGSGPDYILVRGCTDSRQNIGRGGSTYAVWTHLEGAVSASEASNSSLVMGGTASAAKAATAAGVSTYTYDFAAGPYSAETASPESHTLNYAVGPAAGSTSYLKTCTTQAAS